MLDLTKTFAKTLDLIRGSRFFQRTYVLINLYFKVILPSVTYGLVLSRSCFNAGQILSHWNDWTVERKE